MDEFCSIITRSMNLDDPVIFRRKNLTIKAIRDYTTERDINRITLKKSKEINHYIYVTITTPIPIINLFNKNSSIVTHLPLMNSTVPLMNSSMEPYERSPIDIDIEMKTVDDIAVEYSLRVANDMEQIEYLYKHLKSDKRINLGLSHLGTETLDSTQLITPDGSKMNMLGFWNNLIYAFYIINNNYDTLREFLTSERTFFLIKSLVSIGVSNGFAATKKWEILDVDKDDHDYIYRIVGMIPKEFNVTHRLTISLWDQKDQQKISARPAFLFAVYVLHDMFIKSKDMFKNEKILKMIQGDLLKLTRYNAPNSNDKYYLCLPHMLYRRIDLFDKSEFKLRHNRMTFTSLHFLNLTTKLRTKLKNTANMDTDLIRFYGLLGTSFVEKTKVSKAIMRGGIALGYKDKNYIERKVSSSQKISLLIYNLLNNNFSSIDEMNSVEELYLFTRNINDEIMLENISQLAEMFLNKSFVSILKRDFGYNYMGMSEFIKEGTNIFSQPFSRDIKASVKTLNRLDTEGRKRAQAYHMIIEKTEPMLKGLKDYFSDFPKKFNNEVHIR